MLAQALKDLMKSKGFQAGRYTTSPYFTRIIATNELIAGGRINFDLSTQPEAKYFPLNEIVITNLSGQRLRVMLDGWGKIIPSSIVMTLSQKFRTLSVINLSTVANNDEIELQYRRKVELEDIIRELLE